MSRTNYFVALAALAVVCVTVSSLASAQEWGQWAVTGALALLPIGVGVLTMARKRTAQAASRSRAADSIERRAAERASERTFEVMLVLLAAQTALLSLLWGAPGALVGIATLVLAAAVFWCLYWWQLQKVGRGEEQDS